MPAGLLSTIVEIERTAHRVNSRARDVIGPQSLPPPRRFHATPDAMQGQPPGGQVPFQPSPFASPFLLQPDDPPLLLSTSQPGGPPPPPSFQEQQQPVPSSQQAAAQAKHGPRHPSIVLVHLGLKVGRPTQLRATTHARRVSVSSPGGAITAAELRGTGTPLLTRSADAVALLPCAHRRVTPQTAGLLTYLFCGLFGSGSFVINFVAIALLQAGDFWFVKVCRPANAKQVRHLLFPWHSPHGLLHSPFAVPTECEWAQTDWVAVLELHKRGGGERVAV